MPTQREDKPTWDAVPQAVKDRTHAMLGAQVSRATRAFGGYGPSATFVLTLSDGRRAFFKGVYPLPEGSAVQWALDEEERVYVELAHAIAPWAPAYYGALREAGWHALLIEAVPGRRVPPWTPEIARAAARSYADFHARTVDSALPQWLSRTQHIEFAGFWATLTSDAESLARLSALCPTQELQDNAREWLRSHSPALTAAEKPFVEATRFSLLHYDTRSDNVRVQGDLLRIFDWPWACVGPPEFDLAAFAQSIVNESGPDPEQVCGWYSEVLPVDDAVLTGSIVGLSGYFADKGSQPDLPGLPRLRMHQRRQLRASLGWAVNRLQLPAPKWLESVAD